MNHPPSGNSATIHHRNHNSGTSTSTSTSFKSDEQSTVTMCFHIRQGKKDFKDIPKYTPPSAPARSINNTSSSPPPRPAKAPRWEPIDPKIFAQPPPKFNLARVASDTSPDEEVKATVLDQELKGDLPENKTKDTSSEEEAEGTSSKSIHKDTDRSGELKRLVLNEELKATSSENKLTNPVPESVDIPEHYVELEDKFDYIYGGARSSGQVWAAGKDAVARKLLGGCVWLILEEIMMGIVAWDVDPGIEDIRRWDC